MKDTRERSSLLLYTGRRLRLLRKQKKKTLVYVSRRAGMHYANLIRIEQGKTNFTFWTFCRVLRAMGSSPFEFFKMKAKTGKRYQSAYSFRNKPLWMRVDQEPSKPHEPQE